MPQPFWYGVVMLTLFVDANTFVLLNVTMFASQHSAFGVPAAAARTRRRAGRRLLFAIVEVRA